MKALFASIFLAFPVLGQASPFPSQVVFGVSPNPPEEAVTVYRVLRLPPEGQEGPAQLILDVPPVVVELGLGIVAPAPPEFGDVWRYAMVAVNEFGTSEPTQAVTVANGMTITLERSDDLTDWSEVSRHVSTTPSAFFRIRQTLGIDEIPEP